MLQCTAESFADLDMLRLAGEKMENLRHAMSKENTNLQEKVTMLEQDNNRLQTKLEVYTVVDVACTLGNVECMLSAC